MEIYDVIFYKITSQQHCFHFKWENEILFSSKKPSFIKHSSLFDVYFYRTLSHFSFVIEYSLIGIVKTSVYKMKWNMKRNEISKLSEKYSVTWISSPSQEEKQPEHNYSKSSIKHFHIWHIWCLNLLFRPLILILRLIWVLSIATQTGL